MSIMGKKVWAIVCGAIRQEFELYTTLAMLCDYRSKGLLEGIVISTWKGEVENIPQLREKLKQLDIYTVELDPLDDDLGKFMLLNYARQAYQLKKGLDFLPEDVFVLKCRTDFAINKIYHAGDVLDGKVDLNLGSFGGLHTGLKYRMAVMRYSAMCPFYLTDGCFVGYKQDLYKTANFESTIVRYNNFILPDLCFFVSVFFNQFPIISQFYTYFDYNLLFAPANLSNKIKTYLDNANEEQKNNFILPSLLNKIYALYFVLLENCFYRFSRSPHDFDINDLDILDVFSLNKKIGMSEEWPTAFGNLKVFEMIVEGKCKPTKAYIALYKEICKMAMPGYAEKLFFSDTEINEFINWMKKVLNYDPKNLIRKRAAPIAVKNDTDYETAIDYLFDDYNLNDSVRDVIHTIANDGRWCYHVMTENLDKVRKNNNDIYQIMLGSACRVAPPAVLKTTAKMIYNNEIDEKYLQNACFIFDRWGYHATHFYTFPLHPYKISAFYWYGKYAEPIGKNTMPKVFYNRLIQNFKLPARPEPLSYADAVLEVIKEIVAARFDERMSDPSIHNLVDFLIDDFGKEAFTAEQWEAVAEYALNRKYSLPFKTADDDAFEHLLAGAENAETELEANIVSKLLLREKWNFPELARSADDALSRLIEKYPATASCFTKANFINEDEILTFSPDELDDNNDFVLLVRILAERKLLSRYAEVLLNMYGSDTFRRMILELFIKLEENEEVRFFSVKNSKEAWIHYSRFSKSKINSELILQRNNDWWSWPFLDSASPSSYAALIRADADKIFVSIEINSCPCSVKTKLLDAVDKTKVNAFNKDDRIIRLRTATYQFESTDKIGEAVESALNSFCEVGELLLNAAGEAEEGEQS